MSRYIDADSIEYYNPSFYGLESLVSIQEDNDLIVSKEDIEHECPTVDVAEVVRCKGCKYRNDDNGNCYVSNFIAGLPCMIRYVGEDDYCSYGKHKE